MIPVVGDACRLPQGCRLARRSSAVVARHVFTSERGAPFTTAGFARMIERAGRIAELSFKAHPHMLRHACGYALANRGHDTRALQAYLDHRNIQHTVRYTELSPTRFKDFWREWTGKRKGYAPASVRTGRGIRSLEGGAVWVVAGRAEWRHLLFSDSWQQHPCRSPPRRLRKPDERGTSP